MIPRGYRAERRLRQRLQLFAVAFLLLPLAGGVAGAALKWRLAQGEARLAQLRTASALAQSGSAAIDAARAYKATTQQALVSLAALRGAGDAVRVADAIEAGLSPQLSLDQVSFSREAQVQSAQAAPQGQLVLPALTSNGAAEAWLLSHRLELSGVAAGYPALSTFLGKLAAQPGFAQVRLVRSSGAGAGRADAAQAETGVQFTVSAALERLP